MKQLSYTFKPGKESVRHTLYREEELNRMTLFQLRDICERETIIQAAVDYMDREELIHLILRFRGSRTPRLIKSHHPSGFQRLETALKESKKIFLPNQVSIPGKLTVFNDLDTNLFDGYAIDYIGDLDGVNAVILDKEENLCAILNIESFPGINKLYITRSSHLVCREASVRDYHMYLFPLKLSDNIWALYTGSTDVLPPEIQLYRVSLMDFSVRNPVESPVPLAIDFGTSNSAAGLYMDHIFYNNMTQGTQMSQIQPGKINYVQFLSASGERTPLLPTVIGVDRIEDGKVRYKVGLEAEEMVNRGYMGEDFCVFYDIKRWVSSYETEERLIDYQGNRIMVSRKEIIRSFIQYVIHSAEQRFKCRFTSVYLSFPVKQKERFLSLYREILSGYTIDDREMLDEGVAALYSTIMELMKEKQYEEDTWYKALIIDCGGGTTDLSSCEFSIRNEREAYRIDIETAYENGDTDFGGNNLTFRILQLLKIAAAQALSGQGTTIAEIASVMDRDIYQTVDQQGAAMVYENLERAYREAERVIPTRFKDYENRSKEDYYMVKNNYYHLFSLAEQVKKAFFQGTQIDRIFVGSENIPTADESVACLCAARWKMAAVVRDRLVVQKEFPGILLKAPLIKLVLKADIYDIIRRFLEKLHKKGELNDFHIIKLTGQSCKIDLFQDCIKEFVPGRLIRQRQEKNEGDDYRLKLTCLEGAIRYISDKRLGYARVNITAKSPALPYVLSTYTHTGEKRVLIQSFDRSRIYGSISRAESVELRLHLEDAKGIEKHIYYVFCNPGEFQAVTYEQLAAMHSGRISQDEVDEIINGEIRYFVWADSGQWGFSVVPVKRRDEEVFVGKQQLLPFENDSWNVNYFDGTR
ncbi:MAG: molecular chaperone [Hungatella sp.]|jgi:hypothetical protein|nr:molecular chaperone [Hungatella sp.]